MAASKLLLQRVTRTYLWRLRASQEKTSSLLAKACRWLLASGHECHTLSMSLGLQIHRVAPLARTTVTAGEGRFEGTSFFRMVSVALTQRQSSFASTWMAKSNKSPRPALRPCVILSETLLPFIILLNIAKVTGRSPIILTVRHSAAEQFALESMECAVF